MEEKKWLGVAKKLQAIAQAGLEYSKDKYDLERFEEIRKISIEKANDAKVNEILRLTMPNSLVLLLCCCILFCMSLAVSLSMMPSSFSFSLPCSRLFRSSSISFKSLAILPAITAPSPASEALIPATRN